MALIDVVKYNGDPDIFAWKYPEEELSAWTQLIVNKSQEAILVREGRIVALFGSGRYTLNTKNVPLLKEIRNIPFGGKSPFTAEVWFFNKAQNLDVKWGTQTPIQVQDCKYGVFIPVCANGTIGIRISDSYKFLTQLVGTVSIFNKQNISNYFHTLCATKVKDIISSYLMQKEISILEINTHIDEISKKILEIIAPVMMEYGVEVVSCYVNDISVPENDISVEQLKKALAKRAEVDILGYEYQL